MWFTTPQRQAAVVSQSFANLPELAQRVETDGPRGNASRPQLARELRFRALVVRDAVEIVNVYSAGIEAEAHRGHRKSGVVLHPAEALLFRRGYQTPVGQETGRGLVEMSRDAENFHGKTSKGT